jgi:tetratricopeptide (TPR) repeat protein
MPTVSRHEVSRWERRERIPGRFWLHWLAVVLDTPLETLEAAVAASRGHSHQHQPPPPDHRRLWHPPTATELLATLDNTPTHDLRELAHTWLTGPPEQTPTPPPQHRPPEGAPDGTVEQLTTRLNKLRRCDDLIGGLNLAPHINHALRAAVATLQGTRNRTQQRERLQVIAGYAQLAGWAHSDAGDNPAARRAYRTALRAAAAAADPLMAAHTLAALSHHCLTAGDPHEALLLARSGHAGARQHGTPLLRALLLHRIALAAARTGEPTQAAQALHHADLHADRSQPADEPQWLYWLDQHELAAMTGRCLAVLGRPARAVTLLTIKRDNIGPRTAALYAAWLARSYQALGEHEHANHIAAAAARLANASGSARAEQAIRHLQARVLASRYRTRAGDAGREPPQEQAAG